MEEKNKALNKHFVYIIGIIISIIFILALYKHLNSSNEDKFDGIAVVLLSLAIFPWATFFIDKATLPGGWRFEFRELRNQQKEQKENLDTLGFLFSNLVTKYEARILEKLNSGEKFSYTIEGHFEDEILHLIYLGFINRLPAKGIRTIKRDIRPDNDLRDHVFITEKGKEYLKHRQSMIEAE